MFPFGPTVTVLRDSAPGVDAYGDPLPGTVERIDIPKCGVAPRYSTEPTERGRQGVIVGLSLYAPAGADIRSTDRVEVAGLAYAAEGEPGAWVNPFTGTDFGFEVALKRATG